MSSPIADMTDTSGHRSPFAHAPERVVIQCPAANGRRTTPADELVLSQQAHELARLSGAIHELESALARCRATDPAGSAGTRPAPVTDGLELTRSEATTGRCTPVTPAKVVIQPTVYTNIGSLMDVFA